MENGNENRILAWKRVLNKVIFGYDTFAGKAFDIALIIAINTSVIIVMLDSVPSIHTKYGNLLEALEWFFTILFTLEYVARVFCVNKPIGYIFSFYGIIDFLSIVPTYLSFFFPGAQYFADIRAVRLIRIFRILKLARYVQAAQLLSIALKDSRAKITVFLVAVLTVVVLAGTLMYLIEGAENGFESIPHSIYWAIVTLTTVGYGDISPGTPLGKFLASMLMILGYGLIAVPTGIVGAELAQSSTNLNGNSKRCKNCSYERHDDDAKFCKLCGKPV